MTTRGFYSAVAHKTDDEMVTVRARVREDLDALREFIPTIEVIGGEGTDYAFRAHVLRDDWEEAIAEIASEIDYTNYKDAVTERQGVERHDVYMRVWGALLALQHPSDF